MSSENEEYEPCEASLMLLAFAVARTAGSTLSSSGGMDLLSAKSVERK
jgi:hypothetical protein